MDISLISETYPGDINGVATTLGALVGGLESRGHNVDVVCPKSPERQFLRSGRQVSSARLPFYPQVRMGFFSTRAFMDRWEEDPPEVVHIATEGPLGYTALKAAVRMGLPVSTSFHTNFHQYTSAYRLGWLTRPAVRYLRWFHNQADLTFVPTESQSKSLSATGFCRLAVLGRGVDTELFHPHRRDERLRMNWGAHSDTPVLLFVGRLAAEKNLSLFVAAVKKAIWVNPSAVVVVVGDGPERAWLEKSLPDVIFTGALSGAALARCYASADAFIQPSSTETFGIVLLEAMASGLATLSYNYAAGEQLIAAGDNGYLASFADQSDFIRLVPRLLEANVTLKARARDTACQYAWSGVVEDFETRLERLVDFKPSRLQADNTQVGQL